MTLSRPRPFEPKDNGDESKAFDRKARKPITCVALDMDGLLFDTERIYWQVGDTVLQRRGFRYSAELQERMMGRIGIAATRQMVDFHNLDDDPHDLMREADELYGDLLPQLLRPMPGLSEWIDHLQTSDVPFALTTSSQRRWVDLIFESIDWHPSLVFTLTGDDVTHGKPDPEMYLAAAERFDVRPESMMVLEDSGNGCRAGVAAGAQVVAIPNQHTRTQDFAGAALIAGSLLDPELWQWLSDSSQV